MQANGSVVWFVAVCHGVARFLPIQVDGAEVMCHDELCKLLCKNLDTCASAGRPIGVVLVAEFVSVKRT